MAIPLTHVAPPLQSVTSGHSSMALLSCASLALHQAPNIPLVSCDEVEAEMVQGHSQIHILTRRRSWDSNPGP